MPVVNTFLLYQRKTASVRSRRKAKIGTKILRLCQKLYPWLRTKQARSTKCWPIKFSAIFLAKSQKTRKPPPKGSVPAVCRSPAGAGPAAAPPLPPQGPAPPKQGAPDKSRPAQRCRERHGQKRPAGRDRCPTGYPVKEPFCPISGAVALYLTRKAASKQVRPRQTRARTPKGKSRESNVLSRLFGYLCGNQRLLNCGARRAALRPYLTVLSSDFP